MGRTYVAGKYDDRIDSLRSRYLPFLLADRTTGKNIIWATDNYEGLGREYGRDCEMYPSLIYRDNKYIVAPRCIRSEEDKKTRSKKSAEIVTPARQANLQVSMVDDAWFGRKGVFNTPTEDGWIVNRDLVEFPEGKTWEMYVDGRYMEMCTGGDAPYLQSRYDSQTGEYFDVPDRIGVLDRKLRVVSENAKDKEEWYEWAMRAVESVYGFEYQGDSLLLARENLFLTFVENALYTWNEIPDHALLKRLCRELTWNIFQMDGVTGTVPNGQVELANVQLTLFDEPEDIPIYMKTEPCKIHDWRANKTIRYNDLRV